jgi:hypothetical protein
MLLVLTDYYANCSIDGGEHPSEVDSDRTLHTRAVREQPLANLC